MSIYVCSDIHGAYDKFKKLIKLINFNEEDTMYILGDVIDRGRESIPLLQDIMSRENIILLLGNHEKMMYNTFFGTSNDFRIWNKNGGYTTYSAFIKLPKLEQEIIFDYFIHLPIVVPDLVVNDKHYYLAHSSFISNENITGNETIKTMSNENIIEAIWSRNYPFNDIKNNPAYKKNKNKILIAGHTVTSKLTNSTKNRIFRGCKGHYINIDCGCSLYAQGNNNGKLGCLCLNTNKEFYI